MFFKTEEEERAEIIQELKSEVKSTRLAMIVAGAITGLSLLGATLITFLASPRLLLILPITLLGLIAAVALIAFMEEGGRWLTARNDLKHLQNK